MLEQQVVGLLPQRAPGVDCSTPSPYCDRFHWKQDDQIYTSVSESQLGRFVWRGRKIAASQHGLYTVSFNRAGEVIDRKYYPESKIIDA